MTSYEEIKKSQKEYLDKFLEEDIDVTNESEMIKFFSNLTRSKAEELGFRSWGNSCFLIPLCFYDILPNGLSVISIFGDRLTVGKDYIDDDTRAGLLAYGVKVKEEV